MPKVRLLLPYLNTFLFSSVQMILYVTIPYISEVSSISISHIAGSISIGSLLFAFTGPFWASMSDRFGRKKILGVGMVGLGSAFLLLSSIFALNPHLELTTKIALIYLSRIIYGLLASAVVPVSQAWQLDLYPNKDRIKVLTRNSMCLNLGRITGPILVLFKGVNFDELIYVYTAIIISLALYEIFATRENNSWNKEAHKIKFENYLGLVKKSMLPILLALIFTSFIGILHSTLGHHLKTVFNIRGDVATIFMAKIVIVISILGFLTQFISQKTLKKKSSSGGENNLRWKLMLFIGSITLIAGAITLNNATTTKDIWVAVCILSLGLSLIPPVYLALISKKNTTTADNDYGKQVGLASVAHSLGYALGAGLMALVLKVHLFSIGIAILIVSVAIFAISITIGTRKEIY